MYPYNTNNYTNTNMSVNANFDRSKKCINAARKEMPEPLNDNQDLSQLFSAAMADEAKDAAKYEGMMDYLSKNGHSDLADVAKSMYADESKHKTMLQTLADENGIEYDIPEEIDEQFDYSPEGILNNVNSEIEGARFYRDFSETLNNENIKNNPVNVGLLLSDEQNHAILNNYIYLMLLNRLLSR